MSLIRTRIDADREKGPSSRQTSKCGAVGVDLSLFFNDVHYLGRTQIDFVPFCGLMLLCADKAPMFGNEEAAPRRRLCVSDL